MLSIYKLARQFKLKLAKSLEEDPLVKHPNNPRDAVVQPETTSEIDEIIKDSLNIILLMQRELNKIDMSQSMAKELAKHILVELETIETILHSPDVLEYDINRETGPLKEALDSISMINHALSYANGVVKMSHKLSVWGNELEENLIKTVDLAFRQSEYMEQHVSDPPIRMVEKVDRDVDTISPEEIHIEHPLYGNENITEVED